MNGSQHTTSSSATPSSSGHPAAQAASSTATVTSPISGADPPVLGLDEAVEQPRHPASVNPVVTARTATMVRLLPVTASPWIVMTATSSASPLGLA